MATLRAHGLARHSHVIGKTNDRGVVEVWRDAKARVQRAAARPAAGLGRGELAHRRAARQPGLRRCRARRGRRRRRPGPAPAPELRPGRRRRRAVRCTGAAARSRSCASRASTAGRDELRDGAGRLRHLRRAHERPAVRPRAARPCSRASSPAAASATATRWAPARAGRARSCSTRRWPSSSRPSSTAPTRFALGVCNGCQMMAALRRIIPGAAGLAAVHAQPSEQFEARLSLVEVLDSPSLFFTGMAGSRLPIAVAHGEGYADFSQRGDADGGAARDALRRPPRRGRPRPTRSTRTAAPTA